MGKRSNQHLLQSSTLLLSGCIKAEGKKGKDVSVCMCEKDRGREREIETGREREGERWRGEAVFERFWAAQTENC